RPAEQAPLLEVPEDPAQVSRVQVQIAGELGRRRPVPVCQLVEHTPLGEGEGASEEPFVEHADLPGVKAIEAPAGGHALLDVALDLHFHPQLMPAVMNDTIKQIY